MHAFCRVASSRIESRIEQQQNDSITFRRKFLAVLGREMIGLDLVCGCWICSNEFVDYFLNLIHRG